MANATLIAHETAQAVFTAAFRGHVGTYAADHKSVTLPELAKTTQIRRRTLESYRDGECLPSMVNLLRIKAVLPAAFSNEIDALAGLGKAEKITPGAITIHQAIAHVGELLAQHARHMADGRLDAREAARERDEMKRLVETLQKAIADPDNITDFPQGRANRAGGAA